MKISILIIAHNEEQHIAKCVESVLDQTMHADEIILIAHNCTDRTIEIAKQYPITLIEYIGPTGITYARIKGLEVVQGDIVLCIDGDSFAQRNWVEVMTSTLMNRNNVLVGSWINLSGTLFGSLSNVWNKYWCVSKDTRARPWIWGPSFGFWGKDKETIKTIFEKSFSLSEKLRLSRNPDDYWLALSMQGNMTVTNKTHVTQHAKETTSLQAIKRNRENNKNARRMREYIDTRKPR